MSGSVPQVRVVGGMTRCDFCGEMLMRCSCGSSSSHRPNTRCPDCGYEWHVVGLDKPPYVKTIDCPSCHRHWDEDHVECWTQIVWPYPLCPACKQWGATKRPCTMASIGECDCPKCQGLCTCGEDQQ